ncbi:cell wall hydrolase [Zavarzinia compransoris]|uniref:cell wall hydrolase n=1 Tax=Zavarzinia marina TaxID=2911065 RepID=UPI001F241EE3|nr:cell wall hydrolase [Zavarzinia marina]MCF4166329.1 cell wall hydrolase [Zavarzinia marina]
MNIRPIQPVDFGGSLMRGAQLRDIYDQRQRKNALAEITPRLFSGDTNALTELAGVAPELAMNWQSNQLDSRRKAAEFAVKVAAGIESLPEDQRADAYRSILPQLQGAGFDVSRLPSTYDPNFVRPFAMMDEGFAKRVGSMPQPLPGYGGSAGGATGPSAAPRTIVEPNADALPPPEFAGMSDTDKLALMMVAEDGQSPEGMTAVGATILNRVGAGRYGKGISDVITAPNQFEPMSDPAKLMSLRGTPQFAEAQRIAADLMAGRIQDPTGGATHFYSPTAQQALGRPAPSWAAGRQGQRIGNQMFYAGVDTPSAGGTAAGAAGTPQSNGAPPLAPGYWPGGVNGKQVLLRDAGNGQFVQVDVGETNLDGRRFLIDKATGVRVADLGAPPASGTTVNVNDMKLTEQQSKDVGFYTRGTESLKNLNENEAALTDWLEQRLSGVPLVGNQLTEQKFKLAEQAGREFLAAILRKDTGAAVTPSEIEIYGKMYLPQPGDDKTVLEQKRRSRQIALEAIRRGLGPAARLVDQPLPPPEGASPSGGAAVGAGTIEEWDIGPDGAPVRVK